MPIDDQRVEVQADGDGVELRQRAADEGDDERRHEQGDHHRRGGANADFEALRGDVA